MIMGGCAPDQPLPPCPWQRAVKNGQVGGHSAISHGEDGETAMAKMAIAKMAKQSHGHQILARLSQILTIRNMKIN